MDGKFVVHPRKSPYGKTTVVSARIPNKLLYELDKVVQQTGRTRNELMIMCIEYALANLQIVDDEAEL
jgi:metal-responsive CopG/Arc/MetJ family transcriptional regulator